jgi:hypothetical protein
MRLLIIGAGMYAARLRDIQGVSPEEPASSPPAMLRAPRGWAPLPATTPPPNSWAF